MGKGDISDFLSKSNYVDIHEVRVTIFKKKFFSRKSVKRLSRYNLLKNAYTSEFFLYKTEKSALKVYIRLLRRVIQTLQFCIETSI